MPKLDPRISHMRDVTLEAIESLLDSARCSSFRQAVNHVWAKARTKRTVTGFESQYGLPTIDKFYQNVLYWKRIGTGRQKVSDE